MAQTVGTHGVAVFTSPSNGDTLDATVVKGNDNNLRSAYVDHDADGGLHVQSSSLATRSSPGSLGRKWLTTDASSYRLFFDDGSAWYELSYLSTAGGTITGNLTVTGTVTGTITGNASTATALQTARNINGVAFNGTADITVTAAAGTLSGATLASGVTASSLTSVGTLGTLTVSGNATFDTDTLFVDAANNRVGVGTVSPGVAFDVSGATGVRARVAATSAGTSGLVLSSAGATAYTIKAGNGDSSLSIDQDGTDRLVLSSGGNLAVDTNTLFVDATNNRVGIGTATPGVTFDVASGVSRFGGASGVNTGIASAFLAGQAELYTVGAVPLGIGTTGTQPLRMYTNGTLRTTLDASGNLGLGVTPAAFASGARAFQIGSYSALFESVVGRTTLSFNTRESGSGTFTYLQNEFATRYQQVSGVHSWFTAPSGTAGNAISFTQRMTLDASGNLLVGDVSNGYGAANRGLVEVNGTNDSMVGFKTGSVARGYVQHNGTELNVVNATAGGSLSLGSNSAVRWNINSTGHFVANVDATYDIGGSGVSRPKDVYLSGNLVGGGWVRAGAASAGVVSTTTIGSTTATTVGATGAAAALPANPLGYIIAHVGTTQVKIPYYTA